MGASKVILAVPVGAPESIRALQTIYDGVECSYAPEHFMAVGTFYDDFRHVSDKEVIDLLGRAFDAVKVPTTSAEAAAAPGTAPDDGTVREGTEPRSEPRSDQQKFSTKSLGQTAGPPERDEDVDLEVDGGTVTLAGHLTSPANAAGTVIFVHGSGSSRHSPRNRFVAEQLNQAGLGTLLFDLLTTDEELDRANVLDIQPLADSSGDVTGWLASSRRIAPGARYFCHTGAAAIWAAAEPSAHIDAIVSRGGRPDLADTKLADLRSPTLLIVGSRDEVVLGLNRQAQEQLRCENRLAIVPGATHLFEEPGALQTVTRLARDWFGGHFFPPA